MNWFINNSSAIEFWRGNAVRTALTNPILPAAELPIGPPPTSGILHGNLWGLTTPVHILVGSRNARKKNRRLQCHAFTGKLPKGNFVQLNENFAVSTPEFCFLQMADELSLFELILLGYEFCGNYRLDLDPDSERGFVERKPLTSIARLRSFIDGAPGVHGRKQALKALPFIAERSASPMESALAIMLTLPVELGGLGLPLPEMNYPHRIRTNVGGMIGCVFSCDLYWRRGLVDIEYDSDKYHTKAKRRAKDAKRRNALQEDGVRVLTATFELITNTQELLRLAASAYARLQIPFPEIEPEFAARHLHLRDTLLRCCGVAGNS